MTPRRSTPRCALGLVALLLAVACDGNEPFGPLTTLVGSYEVGDLVFTGVASVPDPSRRTIEAGIRVVNEGSQAGEVSILGGACMLRPRMYDNSNGSLAWSSFRESEICGDSAAIISLEPGEEQLITESFNVDAGAGSYLVTVTIERQGLIELSAGLATFR